MITIPKQHYVGFKQIADVARDQDGEYVVDANGHWVSEVIGLLGFATPCDSTKAFEKRKTTVDNWADNNTPAKIYDNELMPGFKIAKSVRRHGWNGGNVVWRIEDPRGFELEISSANFAKVVDCSTIINGVIQDKCCWGRDGGVNVLLPESSEPYKIAAANTTRAATKVSLKDVNPGDTVILQDGRTVQFFGLYHFLCSERSYDRQYYYNHQEHVECNVLVSKKRYVIVEHNKEHAYEAASNLNDSQIVKRVKDYAYEAVSNLTVSQIVKRAEVAFDTAEFAKQLNLWQEHNTKTELVQFAYYVSDKPVKNAKVFLLERLEKSSTSVSRGYGTYTRFHFGEDQGLLFQYISTKRSLDSVQLTQILSGEWKSLMSSYRPINQFTPTKWLEVGVNVDGTAYYPFNYN